LKDYVSFALYLRANIEKAWSERVPQTGDNTQHAGKHKTPHRYFLQLHYIFFRRAGFASKVMDHVRFGFAA